MGEKSILVGLLEDNFFKGGEMCSAPYWAVEMMSMERKRDMDWGNALFQRALPHDVCGKRSRRETAWHSPHTRMMCAPFAPLSLLSPLSQVVMESLKLWFPSELHPDTASIPLGTMSSVYVSKLVKVHVPASPVCFPTYGPCLCCAHSRRQSSDCWSLTCSLERLSAVLGALVTSFLYHYWLPFLCLCLALASATALRAQPRDQEQTFCIKCSFPL